MRNTEPVRPRPAELADITALLIRAQSGAADAVLEETDQLLAEALDSHTHERVQWLRFVRFAAYHDSQRWTEAGETAQEIIRLAEPFDDRVWEGLGHACRGMILLLRGQFESAYDALARCVVQLEELEQPSYPVGHAINAAAIALVRLDLYELATAWLERLHAVADGLSDAMLRTLYVYNSGWLHLIWASELDLIGEPEAAEAQYRTTLEVFGTAPTGVDVIEDSAWPSEVIVQTCTARAMLGEGTGLLDELRTHMDTVAPTQRAEATLLGHLAMARAYHNDGHPEEALEQAKLACAFADNLPRLQVPVARAYAEYADLLRERDGVTPAVEAYAQLNALLLRDRWDERRARVLAFEERLAAERVRDEQRRRAAAYLTDPLTGVGNRRLIEIRLPELLVDAAATGEPLAVVFTDLDELKQVNDQISHLTGDDLIRELAQELRSSLSGDDVIARFGGDEFVLVLPGRNAEQAFDVVDHLRRRVELRRWRCLPPGWRTQMSAGLAESWPGATRTQMLAAADEALLRAKRQGKNRVEVRAHPLPDKPEG